MSNFGAVSTDIGAPGVSIFSTQLDGQLLRMSGTSQATPFVTAAASVLIGACREQNISCTALDIKRALLDGAEPIPALEGRVASSGFLDIPNAARILGLTNATQREALDVCAAGSVAASVSLLLMVVVVVFVCS